MAKRPTLFCFGHRGACGYEPENTLCSVRKAIDLGAHGVEVDVHLADGRLLVIHDATLGRTTNGSGPVAKKSFADLRSLDAGHGEFLPTLDEVFDTVSRRATINVELKAAHTAAPVTQLINEYVLKKGWQYEDFLVSSFHLAPLQTVKNLQPAIRIGALIEKAPSGLAAFAGKLGAWSLHVNKRNVTPELVADTHRRGLKLFAFTINQLDEIAKMATLGFDGVFSDYPDRVLSFNDRQNQTRP